MRGRERVQSRRRGARDQGAGRTNQRWVAAEGLRIVTLARDG
jgi:hypothetical protein